MYKAKGKNTGGVGEERPILTSVKIVPHKKLHVTDMTMIHAVSKFASQRPQS